MTPMDEERIYSDAYHRARQSGEDVFCAHDTASKAVIAQLKYEVEELQTEVIKYRTKELKEAVYDSICKAFGLEKKLTNR